MSLQNNKVEEIEKELWPSELYSLLQAADQQMADELENLVREAAYQKLAELRDGD